MSLVEVILSVQPALSQLGQVALHRRMVQVETEAGQMGVPQPVATLVVVATHSEAANARVFAGSRRCKPSDNNNNSGHDVR